MHTFEDGYRAVRLLIDVNWDRILFPAAIAGGLMMSAYLGVLMAMG